MAIFLQLLYVKEHFQVIWRDWCSNR